MSVWLGFFVGSPTSKATFPAYTGATISAPPTTNNLPSSSASGSSGNGNNIGENGKIATIATTGAASKIIHPVDDISLEEIRARQSRYHKNVPDKEDDVTASTSSAASDVSNFLVCVSKLTVVPLLTLETK